MTSLTQYSVAPARAKRLALPATNDYPLSAYYYYAPSHAHGNLLVAGVTSVTQRFYWRFVERAARQGFDVFTLDYRGIGESVPAGLKDFAVSYLGWAYRDLAAAAELLGRGERPPCWIGHSFGGHAIGLLPDHGWLAARHSFSGGAGWSGWMSHCEALKVRLLWILVLLPLVAWKDYMAWSLLGMGDDLPLGVYRDWKRWCRHPRYYLGDPTIRRFHQRYAAVRTPCLFVTTLDDLWASPCSWDAFVEAYHSAPLETLDPRPDGGPLRRMGYFRTGAKVLWDDALHWLRWYPENV